MEDERNPADVDEYKVALDTRNFEIHLFWQRSNYFLVLNTAIGTGFFAVRTHSEKSALLLGGLGATASLLWVLVNLGSRYWHLRWEQQVEDVEQRLDPAFRKFFLASRAELDAVVARSLQSHKWYRPDRALWNWAVLRRPSVSYMMTLLSCAFVAFWLAAEIGLAIRHYR
jgi:hypothetical protein